MKYLFAIFLLTLAFHKSLNGQEFDYQKFADNSNWSWDASRTTPFSSPQLSSGELDYEVVFRIKPPAPPSRRLKTVEIWKDGVLKTELPWAVFTIDGDRVTYVSGKDHGTVVQVDLNTGKESWRTVLTGVPLVGGSLGMMQFNLKRSNSSTIEIRTYQDGIRYLAFLDFDSGENLGYRAFDKTAETTSGKAWTSSGGLGNSNESGGREDRDSGELPQQESQIDYQELADDSEWQWKKSRVGPLLEGFSQTADYGIKVETLEDGGHLKISVVSAFSEREIFSWRGNYVSVFEVAGDRLYFADWSPVGTGGEIVAVDLVSGKELWREALLALGPIEHSAYSNSLKLELKEKAVWIWGNESSGKYFEIKMLDTGKTVGHKIFPQVKVGKGNQ